VEREAAVSEADVRLGVVNLVRLPNESGTVTLSCPLRPRPAPQRLALAKLEHTELDWTLAKVWYPGHVKIETRGATAGEAWLAGRTEGRGTPVVLSARVGWPAGQKPVSVRPVISDSGVALDVTFRASP